MRRLVVFASLLAALLVASSAAADLRPIRHGTGERDVPLLRAGTIEIPRGQASGRVTVIVRLSQPPLASYARRTLQAAGAPRRLDVGSAAARAYLARLAAAQRAAVASLRSAIPEARVAQRYRVVLNALAVTVPARRLPKLARLAFAAKIYSSLRYTLALNLSPSIIGAETFYARTGARGEGMKIGIVDDGVDQKNPFFDPRGFTYPKGFPKGGTKWTSPKVIVARSFPGPGSARRGRWAVDRQASFHATHVAGIAAGVAGTTAPRGPDHPTVTGLSGVAPRAWIGNYRVFTVPTPVGHVANTPEIIEAFEEAVKDGMDVVNFSGGGPTSEPTNDAMIETIANTAAAGVIPVISAGNDREEFGLGSAGSPGIAPEAISVAAVSNRHVFATALTVTSPNTPDSVRQIPFVPASGSETPTAWEARDQTIVDVGTIVGLNGQPVDRRVCGSAQNPNDERVSQLPRGSLEGVIALASRGDCTFVSKASRVKAAGAIGLILVNNRPGEAARIPLPLAVPAGMVADLEGERLRAVLKERGGRADVRIGRDPLQIETGRSGIVTSFSSGGPTAFGHQLKPDVSAPGGEILSSTLPEFAGSPFAVFDGTSMSAPHVAGAAALLRERHPSWTPRQVKAALVATAGPAWADTARTTEAPVVIQGGGLINIPAADDPRIFTDPVSLSFADLNVNRAARRGALLVSLQDAGGGSGTWQVELRPQAASPGAAIDLPGPIQISPGGGAELPVVVRAAATAEAGDNYGFIVLRQGETIRRIPYLFSVTRPGLELKKDEPIRLKRFQIGDTRKGTSRANVYRYPSAPFGPAPNFTGPAVDEDGAERVYVTKIERPVANLGVAVIASSPANALIHPWFLGSLDENDVQGYAGTPVNVNGFTVDYLADIGAAGVVFPRQQRFFVSVDSGKDRFTGRSRPGRYLLRSWVNDVRPPVIRVLTTRVAAG
ncbi:MAG: S8 family serine peptidase, partial [Actinobacteria bacterium]|nr:S8 family serine peptidase [Actinomycetota bacterium]